MLNNDPITFQRSIEKLKTLKKIGNGQSMMTIITPYLSIGFYIVIISGQTIDNFKLMKFKCNYAPMNHHEHNMKNLPSTIIYLQTLYYSFYQTTHTHTQ